MQPGPDQHLGRDPGQLPGSWACVTLPGQQFQGVWFVLGLAGNSYKKQDRTMLNPYTTVFELKNNSHFEVSNSMIR